MKKLVSLISILFLLMTITGCFNKETEFVDYNNEVDFNYFNTALNEQIVLLDYEQDYIFNYKKIENNKREGASSASSSLFEFKVEYDKSTKTIDEEYLWEYEPKDINNRETKYYYSDYDGTVYMIDRITEHKFTISETIEDKVKKNINYYFINGVITEYLMTNDIHAKYYVDDNVFTMVVNIYQENENVNNLNSVISTNVEKIIQLVFDKKGITVKIELEDIKNYYMSGNTRYFLSIDLNIMFKKVIIRQPNLKKYQ